MNEQLGKTLILIGLSIAFMGFLFFVLSKSTSLPKLPGDIYIKKDNFVFYFPWVSSLVISAVISIILYLFFRK